MPESGKHKRVLVWMRRALRVDDNIPLHLAAQEGEQVIPFLCLSDEPCYDADTPRRRFIGGAIRDLDNSLRSVRSRLYLRRGKVENELPAAAKEWNIDAVYATRVYDSIALERDRKISASLEKLGIRFVTFKDRVMFERDEILNQSGEPFKVFTPYKRAWLEKSSEVRPPLNRLNQIHSPRVSSVPLPSSFVDGTRNGETEALALLRSFTKNGLSVYREKRDYPGIEGTSKLSSALSIGAISIRRIFHEVMDARCGAGKKAVENIDTFISELIWREFYYQILANYPHVTERAFRDEFVNLEWSRNKKHFEAWCNGQTGYPIVDAGMRQLEAEGWMHNRVRMIVASFLTKDLHINWQHGERFFFERLCDADIASNNGGWQWTAGTGTDASPWFRIFNPILQSKKFDPAGVYIRKYVPELASVPDKYLHAPWEMSRDDQLACGVKIGRDYPEPIVDHSEERDVTLHMYKAENVRPVKKSRKEQLSLEM